MRKSTIPSLVLVAALTLVACAPPSSPGTAPAGGATAPSETQTITLMSHDSFAISQDVLQQFQNENNVTVEFLKAGDAGEALNKACLSKENPLGDVFFGVDNTFLSRAIGCDIFEAYRSPGLANIPDDLKLDPQDRLLPVDFGYVNLNYDRNWFAEQGVPVPQSLEVLTQPAYRGLLVVENPATSSPGLAFLLTTIAHFGESGDTTYLDYWRDLRDNDVLVVDGWSEAYYSHFTVGSGGQGDRPLVVSYATSPPADVYFSESPKTEPASGNISPPNGTFRQIEFIGILRGTEKRALAEKLVDFMLGQAFQDDIPLQMFVYPANRNATLPELFTEFAQVPQDPVQMSADLIDANRDAWLQAWTEAVLR